MDHTECSSTDRTSLHVVFRPRGILEGVSEPFSAAVNSHRIQIFRNLATPRLLAQI